jgi:hypothetical protein
VLVETLVDVLAAVAVLVDVAPPAQTLFRSALTIMLPRMAVGWLSMLRYHSSFRLCAYTVLTGFGSALSHPVACCKTVPCALKAL